MAKLVIGINGQTVRDFPIEGERVTIGRGSDNDIIISEAVVSGHHAELVREEGRIVICDLNSTNGTFINGQRASKQSLYHDDLVVIGSHQLRYVDPAVQDFAATVILDQKAGSAEGGQAALKLLNGPRAGEVMTLTKPRTALGKPGVQVAVILKEGDGYQLLPVPVGDKPVTTRLNGREVGSEPVALSFGDEIAIADARLELVRQ